MAAPAEAPSAGSSESGTGSRPSRSSGQGDGGDHPGPSLLAGAMLRKKHAGLTWSQIPTALDSDHWEDVVRDFVQRLGNSYEVDSWLAVRAPHEESGWHIHLLISFRARPSIAFDRLDLAGVHPNVQAAGTTAFHNNWVRYVREKQPSYGDRVPSATIGDATCDDDYIQLALAGKKKEAIALYIKKHPKRAMEILPQVYASVSLMAPKRTRQAPRPWASFRPDLSLMICLENLQSLILLGPTAMGKTSFILSWAQHVGKTALFVTHQDQLRDFDSCGEDSYNMIIFDDMSFSHQPRTAQIHLLDWEHDRWSHCRYRPAFIPAHTPKVFCCNELPFSIDAAITRRYKLCKIDAPLF